MGVVAFEGCEVRGVHVEVAATLAAVMLGVGEMKFTRSLRDRVAQIVKRPLDGAIPIATSLTAGARSP
jgi:hypothetical protein